MKTVTTHYFLEVLIEKNWESMDYSTDKTRILKAYGLACEQEPKKNFRVIREDIVREKIAESEDHRQSTFKFD